MQNDSERHQEARCDRSSEIVSVRSHHSVAETVARLTTLITARGAKVFATFDHAAEARAVGLDMRPTVVVVFGNPKAGTPLMLASPSIAIDLPLKVLIFEDANGTTWTSYVAPDCLARRHGLPPTLTGPLTAVEALVAAAVV